MRRSIVISGILIIVLGLVFILFAYITYEAKIDEYAEKVYGGDWKTRMENDPEGALEEIKEEMNEDKNAMTLVYIFRVIGWGGLIIGIITLLIGVFMEKDSKDIDAEEEEEEERSKENMKNMRLSMGSSSGQFLPKRGMNKNSNDYPNCPSCDRVLEFPFMPKNCPYCNEELDKTIKDWLKNLKEELETEDLPAAEAEEQVKKMEKVEDQNNYKIRCPACSHINSYENKLHHLECEKCLSILRVKYDRDHKPFIYGHT